MSQHDALSALREVVSTLTRFLDGREIPADVLDAQLLKVELSYREIVAQGSISGFSVEQQRACECMRLAIQKLRDVEDRGHVL